jgi:peptidase E
VESTAVVTGGATRPTIIRSRRKEADKLVNQKWQEMVCFHGWSQVATCTIFVLIALDEKFAVEK